MLQHLYVSPVAVGVSGEYISRIQTLPAVAPCWRELCAVLLGNQAASSRAVELHFPATGHRLIFLSLLPSPHFPHFPLPPLPPPLGMIISPPLHRTIIFQVRSYPSLLSFFMACFCLCAALHICTVAVQYVKEVNICSVQNVISIYLFSLLVIYWFFRCLRKKGQLLPCILTNMTAAYALASKAFYSPGKPNYTSEADWLFFVLWLLKSC